jgi:PDZ domain-containing protein/aspartyl protease
MIKHFYSLVLCLVLTAGAMYSSRHWTVSAIHVANQTTTSPAPQVIPFEFVNRHILLPVKVNNSRPLWFVLDTGDQYAVVNFDVASELDLKLRGQVKVGGAGAQIQTGAFVDDATFTVPGLKDFSQPVTLALPIGHLASRLGQDFDGIIGSEFISQFVVEIDYQARLLRLHDKNSFKYSGPGEAVPIKFMHGHPILEAEVTPQGGNPIKGDFVLDIGAGLALALYTPFVNEHHLLTNTKTIQSLGIAGAGGEANGRIGRVAELKIGRHKIKEPITFFSEDKGGALATSEISGNIGARVASKFKLFLDYGRKQIIFEPNPSFNDPFNQPTTGISLIAEGKNYRTFKITDVLQNSPAQDAGLQKDDVILEVDGTNSGNLTLSRLHDLFEQPVSRKLTIRRGNSLLNVILTPRRLI